MNPPSIRINGTRLRESLQAMAAIGATAGGGVERLALSPEDKEARDLLVKWLEQIGADVKIDEMGNIFGRRAGRNNGLPPVMSGSHLDSQPKGGRFDGTLGVIAALEVLRTLEENKVETARPVVIVDWTNEEGTRFAPAMAGSGVWSGHLEREAVYKSRDIQGKLFVDELERIGYRGELPARKCQVHAYYEYHVEQGPVLEREGKLIGVPEGVVGIQWYDVEVEGTSNQVGPTPMERRHDALCAAAEMILRVNQAPARMGGDMVATVGEIHNLPNSRNIIPGWVRFTVDIRSWNDARATGAWEALEEDFRGIAERRGCLLKASEIWKLERVCFDQRLFETVFEAATEMGYPTHRMVSGAGHDAVYVSKVAPAAMIFVPSIGGRSHVEVEETSWEACEAGANVLLQCILRWAMQGD